MPTKSRDPLEFFKRLPDGPRFLGHLLLAPPSSLFGIISINDVMHMFHIFGPPPLLTVPFTQPISTTVTFWTTPSPPLPGGPAA